MRYGLGQSYIWIRLYTNAIVTVSFLKVVAAMVNYRKKKGAALLVAIMVGMMVTILSVAILDLVTNEIRTQKSTEKRVTAKYLAEAGIEEGLYQFAIKVISDLPVGSVYNGNVQTNITIGSYSVTYLGNRTFESVGTAVDGSKWKIRAQLDNIGKITSWKELK